MILPSPRGSVWRSSVGIRSFLLRSRWECSALHYPLKFLLDILKLFVMELVADVVGNQPCGDRENFSDNSKAVFPNGGSCFGNVNDGICKPHKRCKFDGAVEFYDLRLDSVASEKAGGYVRILGCHLSTESEFFYFI